MHADFGEKKTNEKKSDEAENATKFLCTIAEHSVKPC